MSERLGVDDKSLGRIIVTISQAEAFEIAKQICNDLKLDIKNIDEEKYLIKGKTKLSWTKNKFAKTFLVLVKVSDPNTVIDVYYEGTGIRGPDKGTLIQPFYKKFIEKTNTTSELETSQIRIKWEDIEKSANEFVSLPNEVKYSLQGAIPKKNIHKKSAGWQSEVLYIIIAVSFLVVAIISYSVSNATDGYAFLTGIGFLLFFAANITFIFAMFPKGDGYKKIMSKKKILGIMILGLVAFFLIPNTVYHEIYSVNYPEEYAEREAERERFREYDRMIEHRQALERQDQKRQEAKDAAIQKEIDDYEPVYDSNGKYFLRPYWLAGDENDELESKGKFSTSSECIGLVRAINNFDIGQPREILKQYENLWIKTCVKP